MRSAKSEWPSLRSRLFATLWSSSHGSTDGKERLHQTHPNIREISASKCFSFSLPLVPNNKIWFCTDNNQSFIQEYGSSCKTLTKWYNYNVCQIWEKEKIRFQLFLTVFSKLFVLKMKSSALRYCMFPIRCLLGHLFLSFGSQLNISDGDGVISVAVVEEQQTQQRFG